MQPKKKLLKKKAKLNKDSSKPQQLLKVGGTENIPSANLFFVQN